MEEIIQIRAPRELKKRLRVEAAHAETDMSDLLRSILSDTLESMRVKRLAWERRRENLRTWDDDDLEARVSHLQTMRRSDDQERELRYINDLLNERVRQAIPEAA